jgi:hypothetical protein
MMQITNELMYEVLKSIQAQVAIVREDMGSMKMRLTSQDSRLGHILHAIGDLHNDIAEVSGRMDRLESHMGRVDSRLNLNDAE